MTSSYGWAVLETMLALVGVCVLAVVCLRFMAKRGIGVGARGTEMSVLDRLPLDARRSLVIVRVRARTLVLGLGESGAPILLTELEDDETRTRGEGFREHLGQVLGMRAENMDRRDPDTLDTGDRREDDASRASG